MTCVRCCINSRSGRGARAAEACRARTAVAKARRYLSTIVAYSAWAVALITLRLSVFNVVLIDAQTSEHGREPQPAIENLGAGRAFMHAPAQLLHGSDSRLKTPGADWMVQHLATTLDPVLPPDVEFEDLYDELELIVSLVSADVTGWAMPGRFMWRKEGHRGSGSLVQRTSKELDQLGDHASQHPLLTAGLFSGQTDRLRIALESVAQVAGKVAR